MTRTVLAQLGDWLALTVKVEHAFLLSHVRFVIVKVLATVSSMLLILIKKSAIWRLNRPILISVAASSVSLTISGVKDAVALGIHRLLQIVVLVATEE